LIEHKSTLYNGGEDGRRRRANYCLHSQRILKKKEEEKEKKEEKHCSEFFPTVIRYTKQKKQGEEGKEKGKR